MADTIVVEMMTAEFPVWRCLHGGPLTRESMEQWDTGGPMDWEGLRTRNLPLLKKLTERYGGCAVIARDGENIVGTLRFYPKAVWETPGAGVLCLQQFHPAGPAKDFIEQDFPELSEIEDKTLEIHCVMTGSPGLQDNPYQRKGIGSRMVRFLIAWAKERGWKHIRVNTHENIPLLYEHTGSAGCGFWEKLGFQEVERSPESAFQNRSDFVTKLEEQATAAGIDPEAAKDRIVLRLDLV